MAGRLIVADGIRTGDGLVGDAVLVQGGRIVAVGDAAELRRPGLREERYGGSTIIPGLGDAHFHPSGYGMALTRLNVSTAGSFDELIDVVRSFGGGRASSAPLIGIRLDDQSLEERALPTRRILDEVERPLMLHRYCGHVAVANSTALRMADVTAATPDPPGGTIDRDGDGEPTGILRETAIEVVSSVLTPEVPPLTPDELNRALRGLVQQGLTHLGVIVNDAGPLLGSVGDELSLLCAAGPELPLPLSVFVITDDARRLEEAAAKIERAGPRIEFAGLKVFADGSLGGHTAAMFQPYDDRPDMIGISRFEPDVVAPVAEAAVSLGGGVAIHAIGDRANRSVLDFFTEFRDRHPDALLRLEHASVLTEPDMERFAELAVVASVQPAFLGSETGWLGTRLGPGRLVRTYAFRSLLDRGAELAGGSDCPVEPPDPLMGMAAAVDRHGVVAEQIVSASEALSMFTNGVSRALNRAVPLTPGSPAHLTIVDSDLGVATADVIRRTGVVATWVDGESVPVEPDSLVWS